MISLCTLLICWTVSLSTFGNVEASRSSNPPMLRSHSPGVRYVAHVSDLSGPQQGELVKGSSSLLMWHPVRVFRLVPHTLCCPIPLERRGFCKSNCESTDAEPSRPPICRGGHLREGDKVPHCVWKQYSRKEGSKVEKAQWHDLDSRDIFDNKRVVIIGLPGAFTPVCTSWQLPAFEAAYEDLKKEGIDAVYCIPVNDTFVTAAWAKQLKIKKVVVIPDGNACFASGMGMLVRKSNLGFGCRSWRYAAVVNNGVIEKLFMEACPHDDAKTDPHSASTPENVLSYLRSQREKEIEEKKTHDAKTGQLNGNGKKSGD